jgi:pimeloyl-ACP methyl ester carboxylesterase
MRLERKIEYRWERETVSLGMDEAGNGPGVILLPALSSISTRAEMYALQDQLAVEFRVVTVDWPGFGNLARPRADWSPAVLSAFLDWFLSKIFSEARMIVAAGHAATYAAYHCVHRPSNIERLVLIAPTWRGPLPTMTGAYRPWFSRIRTVIDLPLIGHVLYRLNVSPFVVTRMAREHVYSDPAWPTGDRLSRKLTVVRAAGARHASVRFVTGLLDRVDSRDSFLDLIRETGKPTLVIYGDETPGRSRSEIEALAALPNVRIAGLSKGKLSIHEEFPEEVAPIVRSFLREGEVHAPE